MNEIEQKALVERLREYPCDYCGSDNAEAADLIETQAREIERLTLTVRKLQGYQGALEAEVERLRGLIEWVKHCDGLGTFRKTDRREVIISFEDSEAGMTFFERMSDFIDEARAALAGDSHE